MRKKRILNCIIAISSVCIFINFNVLANSKTVAPKEDIFQGYRLIEVDGGNISGHREPDVVVDIGYGDREYWAFTNGNGQLVKVVADKITLQDEAKENVTANGRYYEDEAKVPGTELPDLDEGHIIADSLGGVSNAYNITPQDSVLNRHGDQAYMEKVIRDAGGCTDFCAIISYADNTTQIPSHYQYTYTINGNVIVDEFDNKNPDKANETLYQTNSQAVANTVVAQEGSADIKITALDKKAEYIIIKNNGNTEVDLRGWVIVSVKGNQRFTFPSYRLKSGAQVIVGDSGRTKVDLHWLEGRGVWNNSQPDPAELYDSNQKLVDKY